MQGRGRLRLSGSEVNTLLKLELLLKDVRVRQQLDQDQGREGAEQGGAPALDKLGAFLEQMLA